MVYCTKNRGGPWVLLSPWRGGVRGRGVGPSDTLVLAEEHAPKRYKNGLSAPF